MRLTFVVEVYIFKLIYWCILTISYAGVVHAGQVKGSNLDVACPLPNLILTLCIHRTFQHVLGLGIFSRISVVL